MKRTTPNMSYVRMLLVGRSGSTKSRTAYTATLDERMRPVLALDAGGLPRSIADYRPEPTILMLEAVADLTRVYNWLHTGQSERDPLVAEMGLTPPYKTVILDGFTGIQGMVMEGVTGNAMKGAPDVSKERSMYNLILAQTMGIARAYYALPMHVIGTVLEGERTEGENGPTVYRPLLVGQSRDQLASYAEIVGRLMHIERVAGTVRKAIESQITADTISVAIFKSSSRYDAKDQTGRLNDLIIDPTMSKVLDLLDLRETTSPKLVSGR